MEHLKTPLSAQSVIRFVLAWLSQAARKREWGELRIVVQDGQILSVTEQRSFRSNLPTIDPSTQAVDVVKRND